MAFVATRSSLISDCGRRDGLVACRMNVMLNYIYRDAGNYKNYGAVVFTNSCGLTAAFVENMVRQHLIAGEWFVAQKWNLPDLHFKEFAWDDALDHEWHELQDVELTEEECTTEIDIQDFLQIIAR